MDPGNLKFTTTHEWIHVEGDVATIGITDFAVQALTDLVYIDLPDVGAPMTKGTMFGEVESVKAVSDMYAPLTGEVIESNQSLADDLDALSEDPFGRGWMIKMRISDPDPLNDMLDKAAYDRHCESESH